MSNAQIKEMFDNAVHIGHRKQKWNPKMKKFIYGELNGIHVINLEKTLVYLENALNFISKTVAEGKRILFVSTKPQSIKLVQETAKASHMPYVVSKWIPGLITNFPTIKSRIKYLANLKAQEKSGEIEKYTKKEISKLKKEMDKLQTALGGVESLDSTPEAVFVVDTVRDAIAVKEAKRMGLVVIGIADTNADPTLIDYPIPGNDDALKSLTYILGKVADAIAKARNPKK